MSQVENITRDFHPRCATCGCQDMFEYNEDQTFIKCSNCGREYLGGKDELLEYNSEELEALKEDMVQEVKSALTKELKSIFKKWR